ncbi:DUF6118 family protein [Sphingobium chungangianum]
MDEDDYRDEAGAGDDPAAAFDRLRGEVSLLRSAIEGLTAARESIDIPDYEPTLERTEKILASLSQRIELLAKSPLLSMTAGAMANEIVTAASGARREDARLIAEARAGLDKVAREIGGQLASARQADEQDRRVYLFGGGGLLLGLVLYAVLAGPIAQLAPASWQWPERMAARVLDQPTPWDAGQHLMASSSRASWTAIVAADRLLRDNRETVDGCREQAAKAKKAVRCTVEVKPTE